MFFMKKIFCPPLSSTSAASAGLGQVNGPSAGVFCLSGGPRHRPPRPQRLAAGDAAGRSTARRGWLAGPWWRERRRRGGAAEDGTAAAATRAAALASAAAVGRGQGSYSSSARMANSGGVPPRMPQTLTPIRSPGGRGRGGDVNRPAWMSNGPVAAGATTAVGAEEGGTAAGETRATTLASAVAAGRGRGRGAGISIASWMASGGNGPQAAQAAGADAEAAVGAATRDWRRLLRGRAKREAE